MKKHYDRIANDNYETTTEIAWWAVNHCLGISERYCGKPTTRLAMLEPGCGDVAPFARSAASLGINSFACDLREVPRYSDVTVIPGTDFVCMPERADPVIYGQKYDVIATNPPFVIGEEFIIRSLDLLAPRGVAAFLMKMSFLASQGRAKFFLERPPAEVHILSKRPSFAHGKTDAQEYAVMFWNGEEVDAKIRKKYGRISRLYWEINAEWSKPVFGDADGERVVVNKE